MKDEKCPICNIDMKAEKVEFEKGLYVDAVVCPKCGEQWIDEVAMDTIDRLYDSRPIKLRKVGNSIAAILPTELRAKTIGLDTREVIMIPHGTEILLKPFERHCNK